MSLPTDNGHDKRKEKLEANVTLFSVVGQKFTICSSLKENHTVVWTHTVSIGRHGTRVVPNLPYTGHPISVSCRYLSLP